MNKMSPRTRAIYFVEWGRTQHLLRDRQSLHELALGRRASASAMTDAEGRACIAKMKEVRFSPRARMVWVIDNKLPQADGYAQEIAWDKFRHRFARYEDAADWRKELTEDETRMLLVTCKERAKAEEAAMRGETPEPDAVPERPRAGRVREYRLEDAATRKRRADGVARAAKTAENGGGGSADLPF